MSTTHCQMMLIAFEVGLLGAGLPLAVAPPQVGQSAPLRTTSPFRDIDDMIFDLGHAIA